MSDSNGNGKGNEEEHGKELDKPKGAGFTPVGDLEKAAKSYEKALAEAQRPAPPRITEPRCHVCMHPNREWIEWHIIKGHSDLGISRNLAQLHPDLQVDRRSIGTHKRNHMTIDQAAYRAILEQEASIEQQNYEEGVSGAITTRGILEIAMRKGFNDILDDVSHVEPKDLIQIVKLKMEMDEKSAAIQIEEYREQVSILTEAIQNVLPASWQADLVVEIERLKRKRDISAPYETIVGVPALESSTTDDDDYV